MSSRSTGAALVVAAPSTASPAGSPSAGPSVTAPAADAPLGAVADPVTKLGIDVNYLDVGRGSAAPPKRATCGVDLDLAAYPVRSRGSRGKAVSVAQCPLRQQGFGPVGVHGRFDAASVRAVKSAQRARGLRVSGVMTRGTWTALLSHGARPVLKVGSTGEPARRVQRALTAFLGRQVPITGVMTKGTDNALERYQRSAGLQASGVTDPATWRELQAGG